MTKETLKVFKVRNVHTPVRGTSLSAGIDMWIPRDLYMQELAAMQPFKGRIEVLHDQRTGKINQLVVNPQERIKIPSGIKVKFPKGYCGLLVDKSGVSSKTGFTILAKLIDEDYQGEIVINLVNTSTMPIKLNIGDLENEKAIVQMILLPVNYVDVETVDTLEDLFDEETERGEGGFGSTDSKVAKERELTISEAKALKQMGYVVEKANVSGTSKAVSDFPSAKAAQEMAPVDAFDEELDVLDRQLIEESKIKAAEESKKKAATKKTAKKK